MKRIFTQIKNTLLYGKNTALRSYERDCLNSFVEKLSNKGSEILNAQLTVVDNVQRFSKDKLVTFRFWEGTHFPVFPNNNDEVIAGRVTLEGQSCRLRGDIVFHRGRISSLEFNAPPIEKKTYTVKETELLADLFEESSSKVESFNRPQPLVDQLRQSFNVTNVLPPVTEEDLKKFNDRLSTIVPSDYMELLHETNGFLINGWEFYGTRVRRIVREKENLIVAAEKDPESLCLREDERRIVIVYYDQIDDETQERGDRFLDALMQTLRVS